MMMSSFIFVNVENTVVSLGPYPLYIVAPHKFVKSCTSFKGNCSPARVIYSKFEIITKYIYTNRDIYYIYLKNNLINLNNPTITFQLTDLNYDNLKVERGEIILCQK